MKAPARSSSTVLSLAAVLVLTSCGAERGASNAGDPRDVRSTPTHDASSAAETPSTTQGASESSRPRPAPVTYTLETSSHTVRVRLDAPERFRPDGRIPRRLHFLPLDVVTDNEAERWGDFFLYAPTRVHDPSSQELVPAPEDLAAWLAANPTVRVVSSRTYDLNGSVARELNVERDGSLIFPGDEPGAPGGLERYVLWRADGVWLVGQASTFRGLDGLTAPSGRRDPFMSLLRSARLVRRG